MTQFEMMTSTELSGSGMCSISPFRNSTFSAPALALVLVREREHLVGHVEAVDLARRADALRREQHVDAAARAEVEHRFAFVELRERGRVAAAERREQRFGGDAGLLAFVVEVRGDRIPRLGRRAAAGARAAAGGGGVAVDDALRRLAVLLADGRSQLIGHYRLHRKILILDQKKISSSWKARSIVD